MTSIAAEVFRAVSAGTAEAMVSDAVLAEVAFMLTSPRHFGMAVPDVTARLSTIVRLPRLRVSDRQTLLQAFAVWESRPRLGFVDALTAAQARRLNVDLLTFDSDFDRIDGIRFWSGATD
jgi:predicted nucleic acid-binding protein